MRILIQEHLSPDISRKELCEKGDRKGSGGVNGFFASLILKLDMAIKITNSNSTLLQQYNINSKPTGAIDGPSEERTVTA